MYLVRIVNSRRSCKFSARVNRADLLALRTPSILYFDLFIKLQLRPNSSPSLISRQSSLRAAFKLSDIGLTMSQSNPTNKLSTSGPKKMKLTNSLRLVSYKKSASVRAKFTLFPKLPLELRLKVWRESFPAGRHVSLATNSGPPPRLPTSLRVNRESRAETLRFYVVLFRSDLRKDKKMTQKNEIPFCFNPARDSMWLSITLLPVRPNYKTDSLNAWMDYIDNKLPGGCHSIQILELREITIDSMYSAPGRWSAEAKYKSTSGKRGLEWFSGLDQLMLTVAKKATSSQAVRAREYKQAGYFHEDDKTLTRWFMSSARSPGTKVPNIQWRFSLDLLTSAAEVRERNIRMMNNSL